MPIFYCLMVGENFPGILVDAAEPIGFYATRFVEASSADEAEMVALSLLRDDPVFNLPAEAKTKSARVYFESIEEVTMEPGWSAGSGFTFFPMGS